MYWKYLGKLTKSDYYIVKKKDSMLIIRRGGTFLPTPRHVRVKSVVHKNKLYRDWKSTTDNNEYQIKQVNFKTYERILKKKIEECKQKHYFDAFSAQKITLKNIGYNR